MVAAVTLHMLEQVSIVGSGSWATALVKLFTDKGIKVFWLMRDREQAEFIMDMGYNPRYLSNVRLNRELVFPMIEGSLVFRDSPLVVFAVPSAYLADTLKQIDPDFLEGKRLATSIKGFVPGTGCTPSRFVSEFADTDAREMMVLSGPCHAEEIADQKSTYLTISAENIQWADELGSALRSNHLHTILNDDPAGIEYASILKNIIGIATGIATGLHYGDNFLAVLVSNAMRETGQFIQATVPKSRDLFHSAYFGDLLVTAYSDFSRNRTLGKLIGRGIHINNALQAMEMIAEGFHASMEFALLHKETRVPMPVINAVYRILHLQANPFHEFKLLEEKLT